ncbi:unnamed protein product [Rotaria sp. Silwood1]|nr:unnamed protein product [Rotaria sp. Silwood1]CAF4619934.1 unnamed protein product [Rotaria sp. Silwood1]
MCDAHNVYDTIELISAIGVQKSKQRIDHTIIKSFLAGVFLSFSGLFLIIVGGGSAPLGQNLGPGIQKMIQAAVFPVGLILIIMTSAELFTVSYSGNFAGCLFCSGILVYYAGILSHDPYRSFTVKLAEVKGDIEWHQIFLRGLAGDWLICLEIWLTISARELHSKIIGIYLPIWLLVSVGYEHSIANMFTVQMGMMLGANLSVRKYISCVMIPVTLGNIIGGTFFVGFLYWYLYMPKKTNTETMDKDKSSVDDVNHVGEKQKELNQSQQNINIVL